MSKYLLCLLLIVFMFLGINFFVSLFLVRNRLDTYILGDRFVELREKLTFKFTPKHNNLNIVIFSMKNPGLANKNNFSFKIYDGESLLRSLDFSGYNVGDPSDLKFQFEPIADSKAKLLTLEISGNFNDKTPLQINFDKNINPSFRSYYRLVDKKESFNNLINKIREKFFANLTFFAFWIPLLTLISIYGAKDKK